MTAKPLLLAAMLAALTASASAAESSSAGENKATAVVGQALAKVREAVAPKPAVTDGYSLRGAALGATLTEFRALPHPDGASARILCSGDKAQPGDSSSGSGFYIGTEIPDDLKGVNAIGCAFFTGDFQRGNIQVSETDVGGVRARVRYTFVPQDGVPRLARIAAVSATYDFATLRVALAAKYGEGHEEKHPVRSLIGLRDEEVVIWSNAGRHQTIRLQQHGGTNPRTTLTLTDELLHRPDPDKL